MEVVLLVVGNSVEKVHWFLSEVQFMCNENVEISGKLQNRVSRVED